MGFRSGASCCLWRFRFPGRRPAGHRCRSWLRRVEWMRAAGQIAVKRICGALHVTPAYAAQPGVYPVQLAYITRLGDQADLPTWRRSPHQVDFGPDRLARDGSGLDAPTVGERLDDEQAAPRLGLTGRRFDGAGHGRQPLTQSVVTSMRRRTPRWTASRNRKSRPGTRPWKAAFTASSTTICAAGSVGIPQSPRCAVASRRASLAPRRVGDSSTVNCRSRAECSVRVISWVTSPSVASSAYLEERQGGYVR